MHAEFNIAYPYWTDPQRFAAWLGPDGADMRFDESIEGMWQMDTADGARKYGKIDYIRKEKPDLLVYTQHFCSADGTFCKAPFSSTYPDRLRATVQFSPVGTSCQIHFRWTIEGEYTAEEAATFSALKDAMREGWTASFKKLEQLLLHTVA